MMDVFDDKIDEWHNSDSPLSLYEYIGLTEGEFKKWLINPQEIEDLFVKCDGCGKPYKEPNQNIFRQFGEFYLCNDCKNNSNLRME